MDQTIIQLSVVPSGKSIADFQGTPSIIPPANWLFKVQESEEIKQKFLALIPSHVRDLFQTKREMVPMITAIVVPRVSIE